jgi:hypothetical protein
MGGGDGGRGEDDSELLKWYPPNEPDDEADEVTL